MTTRKYQEAHYDVDAGAMFHKDIKTGKPTVIQDGGQTRYEYEYTFANGIDKAQIYFIKQEECLDNSHSSHYVIPDEFKDLPNGWILDFKINGSYKKQKSFSIEDVRNLFRFFKKILEKVWKSHFNWIFFQGRTAQRGKINTYIHFSKIISKVLGLERYMHISLNKEKIMFVNYRGEPVQEKLPDNYDDVTTEEDEEE